MKTHLFASLITYGLAFFVSFGLSGNLRSQSLGKLNCRSGPLPTSHKVFAKATTDVVFSVFKWPKSHCSVSPICSDIILDVIVSSWIPWFAIL